MNSAKPGPSSPLPLRGGSPPTVPNLSTLRLLRASGVPVPKTTARRWAEKQLLRARAKTEAQRWCFWLETWTEMKRRAREAAEYSVKLRRVILVGFTPPLLSKGATLMANNMNDVASSSKTANATSNPCEPLHVASSSPTSPMSSDNSETRAKLHSSSQPPMTWGTLRDQVRTPSLRQMEPSHLGVKRQRQEEDEGKEVEAERRGCRGGRGGQAAQRYCTSHNARGPCCPASCRV